MNRTTPLPPLWYPPYSCRDRLAARTFQAGTLYLIRCERYYKIGHTTDMAVKRLSALQSSNPFPLELVHTWAGTRWDERAWHSRLHARRVRGEWFELTNQDVMMIKDQTVAW